MSTFTLTADKLGYVTRASYSSWTTGKADQGTWSGGYPRVGALLFSQLRDGIDWTEHDISEIRLTLKFAQAGGNSEKNLGLYIGTRTALTGTGSAMLGTSLGSVPTNGSAYNGTRTIAFSEASNPDAFAALADWIQNGASTTLALYVNEQPSSYDWSANYLRITQATVSVDHEIKGSRGTLSALNVLAGESVTLTIDPLAAEGTVTHKVQWKMGTAASSVYTLGASVRTRTYTVPESWLSQIPNDTSGAAQCVLTTLVDGTETAQRSIPFTVAAGADVIPTFSGGVKSGNTGFRYYQYLSNMQLTLTDAEPGTGATLTGYRVRGSEGLDLSGTLSATATSAVIALGALKESGAHSYDFTVTDSRGRSTTLPLAFNVTAVALPQIGEFSVQRYSSYIDDNGDTAYRAATDGNHVWVTIDAQIDTAGGYNAPTLKLGYTPEDGEETLVSVGWSSGATYAAENDRTLITAQIPLDSGYGFTLYLTDTAGREVSASSSVTQSTAIMHIAGNGKGVAVGMYSGGTSDRPMFESAWAAAFYGGIDGVTNYSAEETPTGGTWIDGSPVYRQVVSFGAVAAGEEQSFGFSTPSRGTVVSLRGMAVLGNYPMPLPHVEESASRCVKCLLHTGTDYTWLIIGCGSGMQCDGGFAVVEYTKTE